MRNFVRSTNTVKLSVKLIHVGLCILAVILYTFPVVAGTLGTDYRKLVIKRKHLEKQRRTYEQTIRVLNARQREANLKLYKCATSKESLEIVETLDKAEAWAIKLEKQRKNLGQLRRKLDKIRLELETQRVAIEKARKRKKNRDNYETDFRQYMKNLDTQYLNPLESDLFAGYEAHIGEIENLIQLLTKSLEKCTKAQ